MIANYQVAIGCDCIKKNHLIDEEVIKQKHEKTNKFLVNKAKKLAIKTKKKLEKDEIKRQELLRIKEQEEEKEAREYVIRKARWDLRDAL